MIVNCKNGLQVENNPFISVEDCNDSLRIRIGEKWIREYELPCIYLGNTEINYLTFSNLLYVIIRNTTVGIRRYYILEQRVVKNEIKIENIFSTVVVDKTNELERFFKYNEDFELDNLTLMLTETLNCTMSYAINAKALQQRIFDKLHEDNLEPLEDTATIDDTFSEKIKGKKLKQIAEEFDIPYNTLWSRINRKGKTLEEAIKMGKGKRGGKR